MDGVAEFEEPLARARGSEWRLCVCKSLPSRDREGAVDQANIATPSVDCQAELAGAFERDGFAILREVFAPAEIADLRVAIAQIDESRGARSRTGLYAVRDLLDSSPPMRAHRHHPDYWPWQTHS